MPSIATALLPDALRIPVSKISRRKTALVYPSTGPERLGTGWSGGSRSCFSELDLASGAVRHVSGNPDSEWFMSKATTPTWTATPGKVLIDCGTCMGKPAFPALHLHPDDFARLFPQGIPKES